MTLSETKKLIRWAKTKGVKRIQTGQFAVEFFPSIPEPMPLDPKSLSKVLTDSMPPDSAMLFASTEDPTPEQRDSANMT